MYFFFSKGAFLIPFLTFLLLLGIPLVFLELSIGQFTSTGPLTSWSMVPIFRGQYLLKKFLLKKLSILTGLLLWFFKCFLKSGFKFRYLNNMAWWSSGMILASGARGSEFDPRSGPIFNYFFFSNLKALVYQWILSTVIYVSISIWLLPIQYII